MTTETDWAAARELCRVLSDEFDPTEHRADATKCNWCRPCAAALAEAREEGERIGAERERRACYLIAAEVSKPPHCRTTPGIPHGAGADWISGAIAARGPMGAP